MIIGNMPYANLHVRVTSVPLSPRYNVIYQVGDLTYLENEFTIAIGLGSASLDNVEVMFGQAAKDVRPALHPLRTDLLKVFGAAIYWKAFCLKLTGGINFPFLYIEKVNMSFDPSFSTKLINYVNRERTIEDMSLMEVKDMLKSKPGLFRKIPKSYSIKERLDLEKRGLIPMYDYFGQHADVICTRVQTTLGLLAASEGKPPYSQEVIDKVTVLWADELKLGNVVSLDGLLKSVINKPE